MNWIPVQQRNCTYTCLSINHAPLAPVTSGVRSVCSFVKSGRRFEGALARGHAVRGRCRCGTYASLQYWSPGNQCAYQC